MNEWHNPQKVGMRIRKIRQKLGMSMERFASEIDEKAKSGTVSNWETGKNLPNNERLKRIAELGKVETHYILTGDNIDETANPTKKTGGVTMTKTINDFFSPSEAAYRWGVPMVALQEKMKPGRQGEKLQQWQNEGLLKYFVEPGKSRGVWILTREIMELWYGEEPK